MGTGAMKAPPGLGQARARLNKLTADKQRAAVASAAAPQARLPLAARLAHR